MIGSQAATDARRGTLRQTWRSFTTAVRLGWLMEANWTDPVLFLIYSVVKPLSATLILVVMIQIIGAAADAKFRAFVVTGAALWSFVVGGIAGLAWSVLDDRERYRMLKYLYVSPSDFLVLLVGRGAARIAVGGMGAVITLAVGVLFLGVPFDVARIDWGLLIASFAIGVVALLALGLFLAATVLQTRQESWSYPEAVAGALFLVVGAVFPLSVLPDFAQAFGLLTPLSWWLEGIRRALFPGSISSIGGDGSLFARVSGHQVPTGSEILLALIVTTAVIGVLALLMMAWSEHRAKDRGLLILTTGS